MEAVPSRLVPSCWSRLPNHAIKADVARAALLATNGGLWIDADTIMLRSPEHLIGKNPVEFSVWSHPPRRVLNGYIYMERQIAAKWIDGIHTTLANGVHHKWCALGEKILTPLVDSMPGAHQWPLDTWLPVEIDHDGQRRFHQDLQISQFITSNTVAVGLNHSDFSNHNGYILKSTVDQLIASPTLLGRALKLGMDKLND